MIDLLHLRVTGEIIHHLFRVLGVAFQAQGESLGPLQEKERRERGDTRAGIAQQDRADIGGERRRPRGLGELDAVVAGIRLADPRIPAARRPIERAAVDDDAAERRTVAADELGGAVQHNIRAVLQRADKERRSERVVDHQRDAVRVGEIRECLDVGNVAVGVAQRLDVERLGVRPDRPFHLV